MTLSEITLGEKKALPFTLIWVDPQPAGEDCSQVSNCFGNAAPYPPFPTESRATKDQNILSAGANQLNRVYCRIAASERRSPTTGAACDGTLLRYPALSSPACCREPGVLSK